MAIVGVGPKGLFGLERLLHRVGCLSRPARISIDLFEPHPVPGAGPVYDPDQPEYLRMNNAADRLNMWSEHGGVVPRDEQLSFVAWWRANCGDASSPEPYPPRAQVGRYLADGFARLLHARPPGVRVEILPAEVHSVKRHGVRWRVFAGQVQSDYDEVLITVGHGTWRVLDEGWAHPARFVPSVFPVSRWLSHESVAPGDTIAIRGFGLTCLDAALAMTEGRGGSFDAEDHPYRLRYTPSPADVGLILPFSRTGRPMLAKPDPRLASSITDLGAVMRSGRQRILELINRFPLKVTCWRSSLGPPPPPYARRTRVRTVAHAN